jgi:hypothetical protein
MTTVAPPRTEAAVLADIDRLAGWLEVPAVQASSTWTADIQTKLARLEAQLTQLQTTNGDAR